MSEIHVEADVPSFSKLRLSMPWSILEILQQLSVLDEMQMKAVNSRDLPVEILASRVAEDKFQLDITGNRASVFEAIQDWWSFSIKSIMSPVYLLPKVDHTKSDDIISVLPLEGGKEDLTSSEFVPQIKENGVSMDTSLPDNVFVDSCQEPAQPILDVPLGAKVLLPTDGHTNVVSYDMGVVLDIPEGEQDSVSSPEWSHETSIRGDDSAAISPKGSMDQTSTALSTDAKANIITSRLGHGCYMCSKTYAKQSSLQRHFLKSHNEIPFQPDNVKQCQNKPEHVCVICSLTWRTKYSLQRHTRQVHGHNEESHLFVEAPSKLKKQPRLKSTNENTPCLICHKNFIFPSSLKKHLNLYHNGHEKYNEATRAMQEAWLDQMKGRKSQVSLPCPVCQVEQAGPKLTKHLRFVHSDVPNIDTIIQDITTTLKAKQYMMKCEKRRQLLQCPKCLKYLQKSSMYKHCCLADMNDDKKNKVLKRTCPECKKEFSITSYYSHLRRVHHVTIKREMEWHKCKECDKKFPALYKLKKHQLVHTDARPHTCEQCNTSFKDMYGVRQHVKYVHQKVFRIKCDKCEKGFRKNLELQRHRCIPIKEEIQSNSGSSQISQTQSAHSETEIKYCEDASKTDSTEPPSPEPTANVDVSETNMPLNVTRVHLVSKEKNNPKTTMMDNLLSGLIMVRNKSKEGKVSWLPLNPAHVPSLLAANHCHPLEVILCEPPVGDFDPLAVTTLKLKTKGLLELASDKKGLSINPVTEFPSEVKAPKVTKPRYKVKESETGKHNTVIKTIKGKTVIKMQETSTEESSKSRAPSRKQVSLSVHEKHNDKTEYGVSARKSLRKRLPPKRLYDEEQD